MAELVVVGIADMKVTVKPDKLVTYALGSCVGICLYDRLTGVAGLSHVLLPDSSLCPSDVNVMKFANTAIQELVRRMEKCGARSPRLTAKIAGGAKLFGGADTMMIGERNVAMVKSELVRLRIPLLAEDTGANYGRTVEFRSEDGGVMVKSVMKGNKEL